MTPVSCGYRSQPEGDASCGIIAELIGSDREDLVKVTQVLCEACCRDQKPTFERLNPVVASPLLIATGQVAEEGGTDFCSIARAEHLQEWALKYIAFAPSVSKEDRKIPQSNYQGPCFYLGEKIGERECESCSGNIRVKEFACHHEDHDKTVIRGCVKCRDYELELSKGGIKKWSVGVATAPRRSPNLPEMLASLKKAGWPEARIFAEPDSPLPEDLGQFEVTQRSEILGAWPNFYLGLTELVLLDPHADAYFMCQDDALFCGGLREYLEKELWLNEQVGVVSLHTPSHQTHDKRPGFFKADVGWASWGAMAFVFSNASARALLRHPAAANHRNRGMGDGLRNVDSVVGHWCRLAGLPYYLHAPSLAEHIGMTTTLWKKDSLEGRRSSSDFVGEGTDISTWMKETLFEKDFEDPVPFQGSTGSGRGRIPSNLAVIARGEVGEVGTFLDSVEVQNILPAEKWITGQRDEDVRDWKSRPSETPTGEIVALIESDWVLILEDLTPLPEETLFVPTNDKLGMILRGSRCLLRMEALAQIGGFQNLSFAEIGAKIRSIGWQVRDGSIGVCQIASGESLEEIAAATNVTLANLETDYIFFLKDTSEFQTEDLRDELLKLESEGGKPGAIVGPGPWEPSDEFTLDGAMIDSRALGDCFPLRGDLEKWLGSQLRKNGYSIWRTK